MKQLNNFIFLTALLGTALCFSQNTAFLSRSKILQKQDGYTTKSKALDSLKIIYKKEIETSRKEIDVRFGTLTDFYKPKENEDLPTLKQRMNKVDQDKLKILEDETKQLDGRISNYQSILDQKYKSEVGTYIEKLNAAIEDYAKKNKLDIVWDTDYLGNAATWFNTTKDITLEITKKLK